MAVTAEDRKAWDPSVADHFVITCEYRCPESTATFLFTAAEPVRVQLSSSNSSHHFSRSQITSLSVLETTGEEPVNIYDTFLKSVMMLDDTKTDDVTLSLWLPSSSNMTRGIHHHNYPMSICEWPFHCVANWKNWWYKNQTVEETIEEDFQMLDDDGDPFYHRHREMVPDKHGPVGRKEDVPIKQMLDHLVKRGRRMMALMRKAHNRRVYVPKATSAALSSLPEGVVDTVSGFL